MKTKIKFLILYFIYFNIINAPPPPHYHLRNRVHYNYLIKNKKFLKKKKNTYKLSQII